MAFCLWAAQVQCVTSPQLPHRSVPQVTELESAIEDASTALANQARDNSAFDVLAEMSDRLEEAKAAQEAMKRATALAADALTAADDLLKVRWIPADG